MPFDTQTQYFGKFTYEKYSKIRGTADKFNDYFDLILDLLDEDKREIAAYKHAFKTLMSRGERLLGAALSDHPVFKLHEAHFKILWDVFEAFQEKQKTRASLDKAIGLAKQLHNSSVAFSRKYHAECARLEDRIASKLTGYPFKWNQYVSEIRRSRFKHSSREEIIDECLHVHRNLLPGMWTAISTESKEIRELTRGALVEFAGIATYCSTVSSLVCKYDGRVNEMVRSSSTIRGIAGRSLMKQRMLEQIPSGIHRGAGEKRNFSAQKDPRKAAVDAAKIAQRCVKNLVLSAERTKTLQVLGIGIPGGVVFPWEIAKQKGIDVPFLRGVNLNGSIDSLAKSVRNVFR